jgi:hypothetical protein
VLDRRAQVAVVELPGDVGLELAPADTGEAGVPHAVVVPVEAADVEVPVLAERAVGVEVVAGVLLGAAGEPRRAAELFTTRLVDEVDDGARRVGPEEGRGPAADHLHPLDVGVEPEEIVGVHEERVHGGEHRHSVFHEHDVLDAENPAHRDVLIHLAAGALHPGEAGHVAQHLGGAPRRGLLDLLGRQGGDRYARGEILSRGLGAGDDHFLKLERVAD